MVAWVWGLFRLRCEWEISFWLFMGTYLYVEIQIGTLNDERLGHDHGGLDKVNKDMLKHVLIGVSFFNLNKYSTFTSLKIISMTKHSTPHKLPGSIYLK